MWIWMPQPDITLYELAMALNVLLPGTAGAAPQNIDVVVNALPPNVKRHFTKRIP